MKKTIVTVFTIIIVLVVMGILVNIVTGGSFFRTIGTAVAEPINNAWKSVSGSDKNLIDVDTILDQAHINEGANSMDSVFGNN